MEVEKLRRDIIESLRELGVPGDVIKLTLIEYWKTGEIKRIVFQIIDIVPLNLFTKILANLRQDLEQRGYHILSNAAELIEENRWVIMLGIMRRKGKIIEIIIKVKTRTK